MHWLYVELIIFDGFILNKAFVSIGLKIAQIGITLHYEGYIIITFEYC